LAIERDADKSSIQSVRSQITEAQKIASGGGSEQDVAEAKVELEVCNENSCETRLGARFYMATI
jgi:hypothetical protein